MRNSSSKEIWNVIYKRVNDRLQDDLTNSTDELAALFSLNNLKSYLILNIVFQQIVF